MFWAYMLQCADGSYYVGHTEDLEYRLAQHHGGTFATCYTYKRRPVQLVWSQNFDTRIEPLEAERRIKGWSRAKKQALIAVIGTRSINWHAASTGMKGELSG